MVIFAPYCHSIYGDIDEYERYLNIGYSTWWKIFFLFQGDVSRAFDTIPHKKLVEVISQVLKPESQTVYGIRWYAVIMITPTGKARKLYKRHVWLISFNYYCYYISVQEIYL